MIPWLPPALTDLLVEATWQTLLMTFGGAVVAIVIGLPLALLLHTTGPEGLSPNGWLNRPLGLLVNAVRSTPFIILMVAIVPFTRLVAGTSIGTTAALVPLSLAAYGPPAAIAEATAWMRGLGLDVSDIAGEDPA